MQSISTIGNATLIAYINEYKKRVGRQFIFETFLDKSAQILNRFLTNRNSRSRRLLKSLYYKIK